MSDRSWTWHMREIALLRKLEAANRRANPKNCPKSLNEREALAELEVHRQKESR